MQCKRCHSNINHYTKRLCITGNFTSKFHRAKSISFLGPFYFLRNRRNVVNIKSILKNSQNKIANNENSSTNGKIIRIKNLQSM